MVLFQEKIDGINWFFVCWYIFIKSKKFIEDFLNECGQKFAWSSSLWDSKICFLSRINSWTVLIFCMLIMMQKFLVRLIILLCLPNFWMPEVYCSQRWMQPGYLVESNKEKSDNWISEFEFCNRTKINTVAFILCGKGFCFLRLAHFRFVSAYTSKPFRYRYFAGYRFGFKVFNQIGTRRYFWLVEKKKKCFSQENAKKVVEGLGTGSFVTVNNVTPHSCGCGEMLPGNFRELSCCLFMHDRHSKNT